MKVKGCENVSAEAGDLCSDPSRVTGRRRHGPVAYPSVNEVTCKCDTINKNRKSASHAAVRDFLSAQINCYNLRIAIFRN